MCKCVTLFAVMCKHVTLLAVMCVLGNKCDLQAQRCVSLQLAQEYATSVGARHFETSALSEEGNTKINTLRRQRSVKKVILR